MMNKTNKLLIPVSILFILSACAPTLYVETDKVTQIRYVKNEMYFTNNDFREPHYTQNVIAVKKTKRGEEPTFELYDVITLSVQDFDIDMNEIYLIVDDEVYPLTNTYEKHRDERNVNEKKQDIMQSDSTKVSVVTGYDVVQKNVFQMTHPVSAEIMNHILQAHEVTLRYTVGPQFINSEIKGKNLENLKKMIEM